MRHTLWVLLLCAAWSDALADTSYFAYLSSKDLPHSASVASGDFCGVFPSSIDHHPDPCPGDDNLMHIEMFIDNLECKPESLVIEKRVDDVAIWSIRVAFGTDAIEVPTEYCDDVPWPSKEGDFTDVWVVVETDCYPVGEIGGRIQVIVSIPTESVSWGSIKYRFDNQSG